MANNYTDEVATQVVISLLKQHGIRKVVASPGNTNLNFVASIQNDEHFEMYSVVDERSAAYFACGLAVESGETVVISCTGATASRNYFPALTEAFYRKIPILAITSTQPVNKVGHHIAQVIDRSSIPNDVVNLSVNLPLVDNTDDLWECETKVNQAILELKRRGGGPAHINLPTNYSKSSVKELPQFRKIDRVCLSDDFPELPSGKVAVYIGAHAAFSQDQTHAIDRFCESNNAVVFCDHTSGYLGKYRVQYALIGCQDYFDSSELSPDVLIHIGEVSGDYFGPGLADAAVWRVSEDGEIRDPFKKIRYVFEMPETDFFDRYSKSNITNNASYLHRCNTILNQIRSDVPEFPLSNIWIASKMAPQLPKGSCIHFGILNSLRSWNFFELTPSVTSAANVGGFGIDGCVSTILGASMFDPRKLYFGVVGDLAFFYDMNAIGNRHVANNLRLLIINNGKGAEFKIYDRTNCYGVDADHFIAAAGHFGSKSQDLIKHYAQDLGFEYMCARSKDEFERVFMHFLSPSSLNAPIVFEVFVDCEDESKSLQLITNIANRGDLSATAKRFAKKLMSESVLNALKANIKK